jgi:hypothetical protein
MENIHPRLAKYISSQQMVNSEIQQRAISLGESLVHKLGIESSTDTLARWTTHYTAEQIIISEGMSENSRVEVKQRCFTLILRFWEHRLLLPNNRYPFKNFEFIFERLKNLDPDNLEIYYFNNLPFQIIEIGEMIEPDEIYSWIFCND